MKQKQASIIDIAKQLNISKSTVSRALSGHPSVKESTRKRVQEMSEKMDYQRNSLALGLLQKKTHTVGIIVPDIRSNFFPSVIVGIDEVLRESGYKTIVCPTHESYEREVESVNTLLSYQVDGIIASHTRETRNFEHFQQTLRRGTPLVMFNRVTDQLNVPKVVVNDYEAAFQMVDHLVKTGHTRIAHLAGPESLKSSRLRLQGYLDALKKNNLPADPELLLSYDLTLDKVKIYVKHFLELKQPPDALFCINDPTALAAMQVIKQKGWAIPKDIALAGFSNDLSAELVTPSLSTVAQPTHLMGRQAAELLLDELNQSEKDASWLHKEKPVVTLKANLLFRESTQTDNNPENKETTGMERKKPRSAQQR